MKFFGTGKNAVSNHEHATLSKKFGLKKLFGTDS
jgi:hypothetical protein